MTEISKFLVFILRSLSLKCNMILHIDFSEIYQWYFVVIFPRSLPGTFYRPFFDRKKVGTEKSVGTVKTFVTEVKTFGTDFFLKTKILKNKKNKNIKNRLFEKLKRRKPREMKKTEKPKTKNPETSET